MKEESTIRKFRIVQKEGNSNNNFNAMLLPRDSDLVNNTIKDPYIFDFITLKEKYKEKELETALINKIRNVLLELGKGFSFVGNQYKISAQIIYKIPAHGF